MWKLIFILATSIALADSSAIDKLVAKLSSTPLWRDGIALNIELPQNTPTEKVLLKVLPDSKIIEKKSVQINNEKLGTYTAYLVESKSEKKIVLMEYVKNVGWWARTYNP
jgi:hypothetical protein